MKNYIVTHTFKSKEAKAKMMEVTGSMSMEDMTKAMTSENAKCQMRSSVKFRKIQKNEKTAKTQASEHTRKRRRGQGAASHPADKRLKEAQTWPAQPGSGPPPGGGGPFLQVGGAGKVWDSMD